MEVSISTIERRFSWKVAVENRPFQRQRQRHSVRNVDIVWILTPHGSVYARGKSFVELHTWRSKGRKTMVLAATPGLRRRRPAFLRYLSCEVSMLDDSIVEQKAPPSFRRSVHLSEASSENADVFPTLDEHILVALRTTGSTDRRKPLRAVVSRTLSREKNFGLGSQCPNTRLVHVAVVQNAKSSRGRLATRTAPEAFNSHSASENMFARSASASQTHCPKNTMSTRLCLPLYVLLFALPLCSGSHGRESAKPFFLI